MALELPPDDLGPEIAGHANVASLTHLAVPDLKTPSRKRIESIMDLTLWKYLVMFFFTWVCALTTHSPIIGMYSMHAVGDIQLHPRKSTEKQVKCCCRMCLVNFQANSSRVQSMEDMDFLSC